MTDGPDSDSSPLFDAKEYDEPSVFTPKALLDNARQQKDLSERPVPDVCVLDPDGDIVRQLKAAGDARKDDAWPGYHTDLYRFERNGEEFGIVGCAVGASFAVLLAEQLFAAGCEFLISVTSSGQIVPKDDPPYFVLIERALRDEGTSHHYRSEGRYAALDDELGASVEEACRRVSRPVYTGATWTTDAPFRETETAIARARSEEILAVEMEAAALYTFAEVRERPVVCFAHVTNQLGQTEDDFEKGDAAGSRDAVAVIEAAATAWRSSD
ncbi:nucleoside phosphorylase [Halobellus clavatus]|jgi:uridine phosphorylase|uniref:Uridine phosphorylase n=1 Tax=Halobellus clavatus TaxID=660517 RepID=A0A1H3GJI3_9EURY|nr:nucleoside phosphorylase [Halobellus clavatus]SDY02664.1 uridine phosphorylase [Halobellus clavatus]